jgi:hypothetical protein
VPESLLSHRPATDNDIVRLEIITAVFLKDLGVIGKDAVSPSGSRRLAETNTNNSSCNVWPLKIKAPYVLQLSGRQNSMGFSRADSRVRMWRFSDVSGHNFVPNCSFGATKPPARSDDAVLVLLNHQHTLKMQSWCYQTIRTPWRCSLVDTKPPAHPEDAVLLISKHEQTLNMKSWCYQTISTPGRYSLVATKSPAHTEDAILLLPNH